MDSIILGTGASEGIPAPFCDCPTCEAARKEGGHWVRTRSDFLIDEENLIDYGPDILNQCIANGINLRKLKNIFLSHSHEDHIFVSELMLRFSCINQIGGKVNIYGDPKTLEYIERTSHCYVMPDVKYEDSRFVQGFEYIPLEAYKTYEIDGMKVTPIYAAHCGYTEGEVGYNYIITNKQGKTFLYASDTGWYVEKTWEYLKNCGVKLDYAVIECTYGDHELPDYFGGHLDYKNFKWFVERLGEYRLIDFKTPIYVTHLCHLNTLGPKKMIEFFSSWDWNIIPGYDGMKISNN